MRKNSLLYFLFLFLIITAKYSYGESTHICPTEEIAQLNLFGHLNLMKKTLKKCIDATNNNLNNYTVNWKISELSYYIAEYYMFKHNINSTEKFLETGVKYAKKSILINPQGIEGKYWLIANLAIYSDIKGPSKMIAEVIVEAKKTMEKMSSLDKQMKYMNGGWGRYIGRFYISMPSPPQSFGDSKKGVKILENVYKKYPTLTNINVLAQGYMVRGQLFKAKRLLKANLTSSKTLNLSLYINRRDIAFTKTLLDLTENAIKSKKGTVSISNIIKNKYNYPINSY